MRPATRAVALQFGLRELSARGCSAAVVVIAPGFVAPSSNGVGVGRARSKPERVEGCEGQVW